MATYRCQAAMVLPFKGTKPMAFHEIKRGTFAGKKALTNSVKVALPAGSAGSVFIQLSKDVLAKIGDPMFLSVLVGEGEHSGKIALVPRNSRSSSSYKVVRPNLHCGKVCVSSNKIGLSKVPLNTTPTNFEITSDGIVVDLLPIQRLQAAGAGISGLRDITRKHTNAVVAAE